MTLQLGNGCSATAIEGGRSVDTSMGFTPLEGLMMGTRSGDVDPSLAGFLARREGVDIEEAEAWLNTRSGLLGVSGRSSDMRELLEAEAQRGRARRPGGGDVLLSGAQVRRGLPGRPGRSGRRGLRRRHRRERAAGAGAQSAPAWAGAASRWTRSATPAPSAPRAGSAADDSGSTPT